MRGRSLGGTVAAMLRRLRAQDGQAASEYTGALLVDAAIAAAILVAGLDGGIAERTKELLCRIGGWDCSAAAQQARSQCVVAEATDRLTLKGSLNIRLVKVTLAGGVQYVRQKRADGTVAVTLRLPVSGGVGPALAKALGVGELTGTVKAGTVPQVTFLPAGDAAANTFARQLKDSAIAAAAGPVAARLIGKSIHIDVPPVESVAFEVNAGADLSYEIDSAGGYGNGALSGLDTLGIRHNVTSGRPNSGDTTVYYRYSGTAGLDGGRLIGPGFGGALAGDMTLAVTLDSHGAPKTLSLIGTGGYQGRVGVRGTFNDLEGALQAVDELRIDANAAAGEKAQFQIDLPLQDPDVRAAALRFLQGVDPLTGGPASRAAAAARLRQAILQNARVQVRTYDTHSSSRGVDIDAVVAGGGIDYDTTGSDLTSAQDYVPGVGFVPSATCHK
jgi:hypothetical protein